ncbi:WD repeat-containing protein 18 [Drosophila sechellia]|uniref:GM19175 n=1 Tax=Drosophila sechellia TaxID=7238 RepID=B4I9J9_DROSE|nr:WD repeat-containing protein 18 [Drosophila sechellia]EDW43880.1 GM19175 [Drosophila sechellia]
MEDAVEALFISTSSEDKTTCSVQDLRTGTDLMRYKGGGCAQHHSLNMIHLNYVMAANSAKPLLHVWPINKQEQMAGLRFVVPGKVNALALTPDGNFLVAGIQENIYLWHMSTGRMLNTLSKHYQAITCLRFTDNGELFISGGKDGAVLVWDLTFSAAPLDTGGGKDSTEPLYSFNDHGLAVTDLYSGIGGIRSYLYTVSLDRCCKVYDLCGGVLLLSVVFPVALHSVIVSKMETRVYVGSSDGKVFVFHMENAPRMKEYHLEEEEIQAFVGHTSGKAITCLALNISATTLVSGGEDNQVCVWDVGSRQLIKSLSQKGPVTNLHIRLLSPAIFLPEHKQPQMFADSLKRMISPWDENDCIELFDPDYSGGRKTPELDYTQSHPGTDEEIILKLIASMSSGKNEDDDEIEAETKATNVEPAVEVVDSEVEDEEPEDEPMETTTKEAKSENSYAEYKPGSAQTSDERVQKLLAENACLKAQSKRMFQIAFKYIASSDTGQGEIAEKTKRKKARETQ